MEPSDLTPSSKMGDEAQLDALLRRAAPPLTDDGFSARVLAALPAAPEQRTSWRRSIFCLVGALAGCGFAFWRGLAASDWEAGFERVATAFLNLGPAFADPLVGAALVVAVLSLGVAFWTELRENLRS